MIWAPLREEKILPQELKHYIVSFCRLRDLSCLARVHTSYQREAERLLYRNISVPTRSKRVGCLDTLSRNREKASLVHSLIIGFPSSWIDENRGVIALLTKALSYMSALSDLRMKLWKGDLRSLDEQINKSLLDTNFRLHTLYCDPRLDLAGILENQPELRLMGIYTYAWNGYEPLLKVLQHLDALHLPYPAVFALERPNSLRFFDHVSIFPAFSLDGSTGIFKTLADSFDQDLARIFHIIKGRVSQVSIYLRDFSDLTLLAKIVKGMGRGFPNVKALNFKLQHPCRIDMQQDPEIRDILSLVPDLRELHFWSWNFPDPHRHGSWVLPYDAKMVQAKEWVAACPQLWVITFFDGSALERRDSIWTAL
ncbi:hypothetical protein FPV67DRAFT_1494684 [Lyophyllum atratum]|nr:hypothetical protein FPV67DRAFT_1494684 [Lyophyllum atratum]